MFDFNDSEKVFGLADHCIKLANDYVSARKEYSEAKIALDLIFSSKLSELRAIRSNMGYEMGILELIAQKNGNSDEIRGYYRRLVNAENQFKALEKVIEANQAKISLTQSILKNQIKQGA